MSTTRITRQVRPAAETRTQAHTTPAVSAQTATAPAR